MKWTAAKEAKLKELYEANVPGSVIAKSLGCSKPAAQKRAWILGLGDPVRHQSMQKDAKRTGQAYGMGMVHRMSGGQKLPPPSLPPIRRAWWLAGWHDKDIEMGNSVIDGR